MYPWAQKDHHHCSDQYQMYHQVGLLVALVQDLSLVKALAKAPALRQTSSFLRMVGI